MDKGYGQAQEDEAPYVAFNLFCCWLRPWSFCWWPLITRQTCSWGGRSEVGKSWLATPGLSSVLQGGFLVLVYFLPPLSPRVWACFHAANVSKCRMQEGGRNCIKQDCLSLLCPLPGKWGCQCSHPLCLVGWCQFQQICSRPSKNGIESSKNFGGGTRCWFLPNSVIGSHLLLCLIAVVRLQTVSDITLHSYRSGAPPKVSCRLISASSRSGSCVTTLTAALSFRWRWQSVDLKSSFFARVCQLG